MKIVDSLIRVVVLWICVAAAMLFLGGHLWAAWQWNLVGLRFLKGQDPTLPLVSPGCPHIWLVGMVAGERGQLLTRHQAFEQALGCSPMSLTLAMTIFPEDLGLAQLAIRLYPENSKAWFWLGEALNATDPSKARLAFLQTVKLDPRYSLAWGDLGRIYEGNGEYETAEEAYLKCCMIADSEGFCCVGAGRIMEQKGNLQKAIEYYRLSNSTIVLDHANILEEILYP